MQGITIPLDQVFKKKCYSLRGPVTICTTTENRFEIDDETRHLSIWVDDTGPECIRIPDGMVGQSR